MGWVCFSQIMERFSFSLPRLTSVVVRAAGEGEVCYDTFDGDATFIIGVIPKIKSMSQKGVVNDMFNVQVIHAICTVMFMYFAMLFCYPAAEDEVSVEGNRILCNFPKIFR